MLASTIWLAAAATLFAEPEVLYYVKATLDPVASEPLSEGQLEFVGTISPNAIPLEFEPGFARYQFNDGARFTITNTATCECDQCLIFPAPAPVDLYVYNNYLGLFDAVGFGGQFPSGFISGTSSTALFLIYIDPTSTILSNTNVPSTLNLLNFSQGDSYIGDVVPGGMPNVHYSLSELAALAYLIDETFDPSDFNHDGHVDEFDHVVLLANLCAIALGSCGVPPTTPDDLQTDLNGDCRVNLRDYATFMNHYAPGC